VPGTPAAHYIVELTDLKLHAATSQCLNYRVFRLYDAIMSWIMVRGAC